MRIKITIIINNCWPASSEVTTKHAALPLRNTNVGKSNVILIFLCFSNNHADLRSDLFNLNMLHLMTYFATVMLIQGTVFTCETSFSLISPLPVNLVTTFHQYRRNFSVASWVMSVAWQISKVQTVLYPTAKAILPRLTTRVFSKDENCGRFLWATRYYYYYKQTCMHALWHDIAAFHWQRDL